MNYLYSALGWVMNLCYGICHNYGIAIILFTLVSKIILLPVSVWTHYNSIKMIKIQPDINFLKAKYYGQTDIIDEEQAKLFKREKYNPLASTIPLILQLVLLMGVVGVINLNIADPAVDMMMGSINLGLIPSEHGLSLIYSPIAAALSAWVMCITQNASNVLQSEQSAANKYGTMIFSVGLSLYLGWFVAIGTAWYWVWSNLMAIAQMYILNAVIKPSKYVDYERLEESRKELAKLKSVGADKKKKVSKEDRKREKQDYKRFFSVVNKHLVFYSESSGFYKYFKGIIEYLLKNTNLSIHYITSDPGDIVFSLAEKEPKLKPYYIGENKLITLMMKMDADVVVMTMPDIENFHIKRSYVRDDIEYVYVYHGVGSGNLTMRRGSTDHYDTVLCAGKHQREEEEQINELYGLNRKLVDFGYPLIDEMRADYAASEHEEHGRKRILIAPSWQKDNIVDICLDELLSVIDREKYEVIVRPHPQEVRLKKEYMDSLKAKYEPMGIEIQTDFSSNNPVLTADLLITDWSDICWEYAYTTLRPVLFINTPMKVMNPEWEKISSVPINISLRDVIGKSIETDRLGDINGYIADILDHYDDYTAQIDRVVHEYLYNLDDSARVGGEYIVSAVQEKIKARKNAKGE